MLQRMIYIPMIVLMLFTIPLTATTMARAYEGEWVQISSTNTYLIISDSATPETLYADSSDGLLKSTDNGASWEILLADPYVHHVAISPSAPETIYVNLNANSILKRADSDSFWAMVDQNLNSTGIRTVLVDENSSDVVYVATFDKGVQKSTDGGVNWTSANNGLPGVEVDYIEMKPGDSQTIYANVFGSAGLWRTTDGGENWSEINSGLPTALVDAIAFDPNNPDTMYAATPFNGVYKSTDSGTNWNFIGNSITNAFVLSLVVDPLNSDILYAGLNGSGIYRSIDGGVTWKDFNVGSPGDFVASIAFSEENPTVLLAGSEDGLFSFRTIDLSLTKSVNNEQPSSGEIITYTLTISNDGTGTATGVVLSDTLPVGITLAGPITIDTPQAGAILATSSISLPIVASNLTITTGTQITVRLPVIVDGGITQTQTITNVASITNTQVITPVIDSKEIRVSPQSVSNQSSIFLPIILK